MRTLRSAVAPVPQAVGLVAGLGALLAGCVAPPAEGEVGSVEDFGRMMAEGGAQPVYGEVEEGQHGGELQPVDPIDAVPPPEPGEADEAEAEEPERQEPPPNPFLLFGERIIVREDDQGRTFVTKPYTLPPGRPDKIVQLMGALEPFPFRKRPSVVEGADPPPLDPGFIEYQVLPGLDDEFFVNFNTYDNNATAANAIKLSDLMVVTATPTMLEHFEEFIDRFAGGGVPQIELEAKIIEFVTSDTEDYGGSASLEFGDRNLVKRFLPNLPNFAGGTPVDGTNALSGVTGVPFLRYPTQGVEALLELGAVQDGVVFDAILQVVEGWQNVEVDSTPSTVVRAGGVAKIETSTEIPFLQFKTLDAQGVFTTTTAYKKVGTSLWISPRLMGSNTLALDIRVEGSQRVGSTAIVASTAGTSEVPVIAYRTAKTVVHLKPGQTLVIGGLTQTRDQEIVSQVPILGDIPILGFFFRSTFTLKEKQTVWFSISPRIIQKSDLMPL